MCLFTRSFYTQCCFFTFILIFPALGQHNRTADSLHQIIATAKADTTIANALYKLATEYSSTNPNHSLTYLDSLHQMHMEGRLSSSNHIKCLLLKANILLLTEQFNRVPDLLQQVLAEHPTPTQHVILYALQATYYENLNDYETALKYINLGQGLRNQLDSTNTAHEIQELEEAFALGKKTLEAQTLANRLTSAKKHNLYLGIGTMILIATLGTIVFLWRKARQVAGKLSHLEQQQLLAQKEAITQENIRAKRMLQNLSIYFKKRNEFAQAKINTLKELKKETAGPIQENVGQMIHSINSWNQEEGKTNDMRELLINSYETFLKKMDTHFPDLTKNEKQLSALIELDLSNQEIAELNRVSERAVKMAKNRLKKKLGLKAEDNLTHMLKAINYPIESQ